MPSKACLNCVKLRPIFAKSGYCHSCYAEAVQRGDVAGSTPEKCSVDGCSQWSAKGGMCDRHYRRVLDHGHTGKVRKEGQHPEYRNWWWLKAHGKLCEEWRLSFDAFIAVIGERPAGGRHWLDRHDQSKPFGPENWFWRAPALGAVHNFKTTDGRRAYQQEIAATHPGAYAGQALKGYGLTTDDYHAMLAAQGGVCAACGQMETSRDSRNGQPKLLCVDHAHNTGAIRGLLCSKCNKAIGFADDEPARLRELADYLERTADLPPRDHSQDRCDDRPRCSVDGCGGIVRSNGVCQKHYSRARRGTQVGEDRHCRECGTALSPDKDARTKYCDRKCLDAWRRKYGSRSEGALIAKGKVCSIEGCGAASRGQGYCSAHYNRLWKYGDPLHVPPKLERAPCSVEGCAKPSLARGKCQTHYYADRNLLKRNLPLGTA